MKCVRKSFKTSVDNKHDRFNFNKQLIDLPIKSRIKMFDFINESSYIRSLANTI